MNQNTLGLILHKQSIIEAKSHLLVIWIIVSLLLPVFIIAQDDQEQMKEDFRIYMAASDESDHEKAFDILYAILQQYASTWTYEQDTLFNGFLIGHTYLGIDRAIRQKDDIPREWLDRFKKIEPPAQNEKQNYFDYALIKYQVAGYYAINKKMFDLASRHYLEAEYYYAEALDEEKNELLKDAEAATWIRNLRSTLREMINTRGIIVGTYVTNRGMGQQWIGKVIGIDENALQVRITFNTSYSRLKKPKIYTILIGDAKILDKVSVNALFHGYQ